MLEFEHFGIVVSQVFVVPPSLMEFEHFMDHKFVDKKVHLNNQRMVIVHMFDFGYEIIVYFRD